MPTRRDLEDYQAGQMGVPTGSVYNDIGLEEHRRSRTSFGGSIPAAGHAEFGPFGKKFLGFGLLLFAWWTFPSADAEGTAWIIPVFSICAGAVAMAKGMWEGGPSVPPRRMAHGMPRLLWALRPRMWLIAWVAIVGALISLGSPHLRITYTYDTYASDCGYFGLNGWEQVHGPGGLCPIVKLIPLR